jgi:hypothetical protein
MDRGYKPFLLLRADAPRAELMGFGGQTADESSSNPYRERPVALACAPTRRHHGGRPDPEGDLIA